MNRHLLPGLAALALVGGAGGDFLWMRSNERGVKGALVMLDAGLKVYQGQRREFPKALPEIVDGGPFSLGIPKELAAGQAPGYAIRYEPRSSGGTGRMDGYRLTAAPTLRWITGRRTFWVDSSGHRGSE
jgi:hypothetical protein